MNSQSTINRDPTEPTLNIPEYIFEQIEDIHPDPFVQVDRDILRDRLIVAVQKEGDFRNIALQEAIALMGDAHTVVDYFALDGLPFVLREFNGRYYIIGSGNDHNQHLGSELLSVNLYPVSQIAPNLLRLSSQENSEVEASDIARYLVSNRILRYFGFSSEQQVSITTDKDTFAVDANSGEERIKIDHQLNPFNWKDTDGVVGNKIYRFRMLGENLLFQYNSCSNRGYTAEELSHFKKELLERAKRSNRIIVDLRQNQGGDTSVMADLFTALPNMEVIVAIGRKTFSSAMHHMLYLKRERGANLVGENAGQKPNRFGDCKYIEPPGTEICIHCSYKRFVLLPGEDIDVISPDIPIRVTIEDYINGIDPLEMWIEENL